MSEHNQLGTLGENMAVEYLIQNGYEILERNWRFKKLEIDVIALKDNVIIVVEVKARTSSGFGLPQDFVTKAKINRLIQAINQYVLIHDLHQEIRFDIIAILKSDNQASMEHLKDAFYPF